MENIESLKFKHVDDALTIEGIPLSIKLFLNQIHELKLSQSITYSSQSNDITLKQMIDDIIENHFSGKDTPKNKKPKVEEIDTKNENTEPFQTKSNDENNDDVIQIISDDDNDNDDTKPLLIPKSISTSVINHLIHFKEKLPKPVKLTTEFIQYLNEIIQSMEDKLNYYMKQIEIILKNIRILYEDLKIEKSKQLKLEVDKLENIPIVSLFICIIFNIVKETIIIIITCNINAIIKNYFIISFILYIFVFNIKYEEELKNLSKMWQDTQKERVDNVSKK